MLSYSYSWNVFDYDIDLVTSLCIFMLYNIQHDDEIKRNLFY